MNTIFISKVIINDQTFIALSITQESPEYLLIKQVKGRKWRADAKLWLIPNETDCWNSFKTVFDNYQILKTDKIQKYTTEQLTKHQSANGRKTNVEQKDLLTNTLSDFQINAVHRMTEQLIIQKYSPNTRKNYTSSFIEFLAHHKGQHPQTLTEQDFRQYILFKIEQHHISESTQNNIINALKFYYEKVELRPRFTLYDIRPRSPKKLPGFLSKPDVEKLIKSCSNIKHQTILKIIYSAGLRLGELTRLKTRDILFDQGLIRVKSAKGSPRWIFQILPEPIS